MQRKSDFGKDFKAVFHAVDQRLMSYSGIEKVTVAEPSTPSPSFKVA
jgi:hypothetical protein